MTSPRELPRAELSPGLASTFRHDLKGGLISLRMGLESLEDEVDLKPLLLQTQSQVERLADQLLGLLRTESLMRTPISCGALLNELTSRLQTHYRDLHIEQAKPSAPLRLSVDTEALWMAFREAAENAIAQEATRLVLSVEPAGESALLRLSDNGRGLEGAPSDEEGLGSHLIGRCLHAHGGSARLVENRLGTGASLELTLPIWGEDEC